MKLHAILAIGVAAIIIGAGLMPVEQIEWNSGRWPLSMFDNPREPPRQAPPTVVSWPLCFLWISVGSSLVLYAKDRLTP